MHTKGKLTDQGLMILDSNQDEFAHMENVHGMEFTFDNARRLVACWNACDGINTEDLEEGNKYCEQPMLQRGLQNMRTLDLMRERDELVDALRKALCVGKMRERIDARQEAESILAKYPESQS